MYNFINVGEAASGKGTDWAALIATYQMPCTDPGFTEGIIGKVWG